MVGNHGPAFERLRARTDSMLELLRALVEAESPSSDAAACGRCAGIVAAAGTELLGRPPEHIERGGRVHLRWPATGSPMVGVLGHFDTVWPIGTLRSRPFSVSDGLATGPGVFDMKAGIVQALNAIAMLEDSSAVEVLFTCDEELGSPTSRGLVEDLARRAAAVLVAEPSHDGALKIARKGVSMYHLDVTGVPAHAGLEPEKGVNALLEMARLALEIQGLASIAAGTTVTPTMAQAGVAINVVPPAARLDVDVRALSIDEQERVDAAMHGLRPLDPGATLTVSGGPDRPPLEAARSEGLFRRAAAIAAANDLGPLQGTTVGGGSDGNITAALGTPTLDGLGAVGGGAHAVSEHVVVAEMPRRAALVALLLQELLATPA